MNPTHPTTASCLRLILGGLGVLAVVNAGTAREPAANPGVEFFEQRIRPLLAENCFSCHGEKKQRGGLRLDSRANLLQGGDTGPAIVLGKPDASLLIRAVRRTDPFVKMPPDNRLADEDIADLERWVQMGLPWPAGGAAAVAALGDQQQIGQLAKQHWAFRPVTKPEPPPVKNAAWVLTPVDAFILARLDKEGLCPAPPADRRTLLRRVTFDLIGLPPTPEEIAAFEKDTAPDAYANVVDRLLRSPHYGERWGRHWLDVARYADTRDWFPLIDLRYPFAYTYRDWVIKALNEDMPYNRFVREQLAADHYTKDKNAPDLAALGFLTVGPRFRNNVVEQIADRIDVTTRGLLGLTATCARCHDHKYDPIATKDYYALYGVFASTEEPAELPRIAGAQPPADLMRDYERLRGERLAALNAYEQRLLKEAMEDLRNRLDAYLRGYHDMNIAKKESIRSLVSKFKLKETAMTPLAAKLERLTVGKRWSAHPVMGPWVALRDVPDQKVAAAVPQVLKGREVNPLVRAALQTDPPATRREILSRYATLFTRAHQEWQALQKRSAAPPAQLPDPALEQIRQVLYAEDGPFAFSTEAVVKASRLFAPARKAWSKLYDGVLDVDLSHAGAPARAMALVDKAQPVNPVVFIRGDPQRRGDAVPRRFLAVLAGPEAPAFTQGSGRRELAEAITDPRNPLTSRVLVNRVWMHHFGKGLVTTPGDFGLRTPPPSHPQLLDWLAATFVEQGWSLKKLHRLIVLSNTYRQASSAVPAYAAKDSDNKLLWRANRRRLDFEAMRDAVLVVSGQLDPAIGGRPVKLTEKPFPTRRTVYGFVNRVNLDYLFATFDFPSPDQSSPQRPETMVPQQALFAMNDPFVVDQARKLAALPQFTGLTSPSQQVQFLYHRLFGRAATALEVTLTRELVEQAAADRRRLGGGSWQYGYGTADASAPEEDRFRPLSVWTGKAYQAGPNMPDAKLGHAQLSANGGHPGRNLEQAVVRRWTAPHDAVIEIRGQLSHLRDLGDGVRGQVVAGRGGLLGKWTALNESVDTVVSRYEVKAGETIDFVVDCRKTPMSDAFGWAPQIRALEQPVGRAAPVVWDARKDFAAPPPPALTAWEQCAQALMLTNEFLFID